LPRTLCHLARYAHRGTAAYRLLRFPNRCVCSYSSRPSVVPMVVVCRSLPGLAGASFCSEPPSSFSALTTFCSGRAAGPRCRTIACLRAMDAGAMDGGNMDRTISPQLHSTDNTSINKLNARAHNLRTEARKPVHPSIHGKLRPCLPARCNCPSLFSP
jgi:hypothetical protein